MILYTFMMFMFQKHETHLIQVLRKLLILYDDDDDDDDYDNVSIQYPGTLMMCTMTLL